MPDLKVKNIGPVAELEAHLPEGGGITVLRGPNDCGKSLTIQACQKACGANVAVTKRDGAMRGSLEFCGVTLTVTARPRCLGELEAHTIEGQFDVSDLIEPGLKDPALADAKRAKALLRIRGVGPDLSLFADLVDSIPADVKWGAAADLVDLATLVKASLHEEARRNERLATNAEASAAMCRSAVDGMDLNVETDGDTLQQALTDATLAVAAMQHDAKEATKAQDRANEAKRELERISDGAKRPTVGEAHETVAAMTDALGRAQRAHRVAQDACEDANRTVQKAIARHDKAAAAETEAIDRDTLLQSCQHVIATCEKVTAPSDESMARTVKQFAHARGAIELGVAVRNAQAKQQEAKQHAIAAANMGLAAEHRREDARGVDVVLGDAVKARHLVATSNDKGQLRWLTKHPDRGEVYYHDRSRGIRCTIAIDEAIAGMPKGQPSVILLRQDLWEGLDWENRCLLSNHCREQGVNLLTAEATSRASDDQRLHAVIFNPNPADLRTERKES